MERMDIFMIDLEAPAPGSGDKWGPGWGMECDIGLGG